jgi:hypothetical protein
MEPALRKALEVGFIEVVAPVPATAFNGRRIAWVCSKSRLLGELLERTRK